MQIENAHNKMVWLGSKNKKHLRCSTQATMLPLATKLTTALRTLVSIISQGSILTFILAPLCFLYHYFILSRVAFIYCDFPRSVAMILPVNRSLGNGKQAHFRICCLPATPCPLPQQPTTPHPPSPSLHQCLPRPAYKRASLSCLRPG